MSFGPKKGFTIVEITVVMAIIAILMVIGVSGLFLLRDQNILDQATESAITAVREAQNRSISFTQGQGGSTKAWGVYFDDASDTVSLRSVSPPSSEYLEETIEMYQGVKITINAVNSNSAVYFASPFGTSHLTSSKCSDWSGPIDPTKEYKPNPQVCSSVDSNIQVKLEYKGHTQTISINEKGDVNAL